MASVIFVSTCSEWDYWIVALIQIITRLCSTPNAWTNGESYPWKQSSWDQHGAHLGPTGPRWAPCWPHEACYLGLPFAPLVIHGEISIKIFFSEKWRPSFTDINTSIPHAAYYTCFLRREFNCTVWLSLFNNHLCGLNGTKMYHHVPPNLKYETHQIPKLKCFLSRLESCMCPIHWSQVLSREWRCSWSSADRRCPNYIWVVINDYIAYWGVLTSKICCWWYSSYIRNAYCTCPKHKRWF